MADQRALWVSTSVETRGGIASYVRSMQQTFLWDDWNIRHVATHRDGSAALKVLTFAYGALQFVFELIRFRPSVVHLHAGAYGSFLRKSILFWISRPTRVPVVLHMHGSGFQTYYENSSRAVQAFIRATLCSSSVLVTLGDVWAARVHEIAPSARIAAIPNGIRLDRRSAEPPLGEPVHIVFLGRIGDRKGTFELLDAWAELSGETAFTSGRGNVATLTIAGDGQVGRARRYCRDLCLESSVAVNDWLSPNEVRDLLQHAQVLVLPSRSEGQPMAVLEAMARGLCIIATNVDGLPEMIGGGCGVLIPPDNTEAIVAALREVVYNPELRARYGAAAYARVRDEFDTCVIARRLDGLYREVCA